MNGIELARRAIRERAGAAVIVVAAEDDPIVTADQLQDAPVHYLPYPPGEGFLRALRIGLDGAAVVEAEEGTATLDLGHVPALNIDAARGILVNTIIEMGAIAGMISDRTGRIVVDEGAIGYVDKYVIAATLGPNFALAVKIAPQIGGAGWSLKFFDGDRYDLYALALGYHYFMAFLFDDTKSGAFGAVTRFGRKGAEKIIELLGESAWVYGQPVQPAPAPSAQPEVKVTAKATKPSKKSTQPVAKVEAEPPSPPSSVVGPVLEPVKDLDLDLLFGQHLDDQEYDDLFADSASNADVSDLRGDKLSFEEAQDMGLLGD
jgi:hypothetical protein